MKKFWLRNLQIGLLSASLVFLFIAICLIGLFICGILPIKED